MNLKLKYYLFALGTAYAIGSGLHFLDVLDLRLQFSNMNMIWKVWIIFLLIFDAVAAFGLLTKKKYGEYSFLIIAAAQVIAYVGFKSVFGQQRFLIAFHTLTVAIYLCLKVKFRFKKKNFT